MRTFDKSVENVGNRASAIICLTPSESKRLIAKAVAQLPEVKQALQKGLIFIRYGSTCAYVVEEILGISVNKSDYLSGVITDGELSISMSPTKTPSIRIRKGRAENVSGADPVQEFTPDDVLIKSANAVDPEGNAGVLVGGEIGIGPNLATTYARGFHLIVPVGLEKSVPSVADAARATPGLYRLKYCTGMPAFLFPIPNAKVVTEIQALEVLFGISAVHIASGGIGGSEGSAVLCLKGTEQNLDEAMKLIKGIKGEPRMAAPSKVNPRTRDFDYSVTYFHESIWPIINPQIKKYPWGSPFHD